MCLMLLTASDFVPLIVAYAIERYSSRVHTELARRTEGRNWETSIIRADQMQREF